jgi:hypothetical protein
VDWTGSGEGALLPARVSPNGEWLSFMSGRSLTGYDNRDVASGVPDQEVFLYSASGEGTLACASCNPTGSRPHGAFDHGTASIVLLGDGQRAWAGHWLAANVPEWTSPLYQSRYLSNAGRLFFNSNDALVPSDTGGTEDVYEYEPPGVGDCTSAGANFSQRSAGCVALISSGTSSSESAFLDASESGNDVFFLTSAQLSPSDLDVMRDVYDARVGGGFPPAQPLPACEGDACQSPAVPPEDPTPGSLTFRGPGNLAPVTVTKSIAAPTRAQKLAKALKACRRIHSKKRRHTCERHARHKYAPAGKPSGRKTTNKRRVK